MVLIISDQDKRIPPPLIGEEYEIWSYEEFGEKASSEGINVDTLYFNVDTIPETIYRALCKIKNATFIYYSFNNKEPSFIDEDPIQSYEEVKEQEVSEPEEEEVIEETIVEEENPNEIQDNRIEDSSQEVADSQDNNPTNNTSTTNTNNVSNTDQDTFNIDDLPTGNTEPSFSNLLDNITAAFDEPRQSSGKAKTIAFNSAKGGVGKSFTCLISAYRYAMTHPNERVAVVDLDLSDGQLGISLNMAGPTITRFYAHYKNKQDSFSFLESCVARSTHFPYNLSFYLAPPYNMPEINQDAEFWEHFYELVLANYDMVFFDTSPSQAYLEAPAIKMVCKKVDKLIILSNTTINSVRSAVTQLKMFGGLGNKVYTKSDKMIDKISVVLTRVQNHPAINQAVFSMFESVGANIIAVFGQIDKWIADVQWYQRWESLEDREDICKLLDDIVKIGD